MAKKKLDSKTGIKRKTIKFTPNTKWLLSLLESKGLNQRSLSKVIGLNPAVLHKTLAGNRRIQMTEVAKMSEVLNVPLDELLNAFGIELHSPSESQFVEVIGFLDGTLTFKHSAEGLLGSKTVPCPFPDRDIKVVRVQSSGSESDGLDGALVYFRESKAKGVDPDAVGRIALVTSVGNGAMRLRVIKRGYASGKYNLHSLAGRLIEENINVENVNPVIWLKI